MNPAPRPVLRRVITSLLVVGLWGCEGGGKSDGGRPDSGADLKTNRPDGLVELDSSPLDDARPDAWVPISDAAPDGPLPPPPDMGLPPCPGPSDGPMPPAGRWSLSLFHFNIQYVAGGMTGFTDVAFNNPMGNGMIDLTQIEIEDRIITESLVPLLALLERNSDFALTFEMQGLMVDVIRERHAETLLRMRRLVDQGQLEIASIHYSDQFFLAFGREDMDESERRTRLAFERAELGLSRAIFTQEGQYGPGFAAWLSEVRPGAVVVVPRNLVGFYHRDLDQLDAPLFMDGGTLAVLPRSLRSEVVDRSFSFFNDGELLATGDLDPYFGTYFSHQPSAVMRYEHDLRCEVEAGVRIGRIADYTDAVLATGYLPTALPPVLDGTWQPGSTRGPLRWMGAGGLFRRHERDNEVLTTCVAARHQVLALDSVSRIELQDRPDGMVLPQLLAARESAWNDLLLGQVSDARGINPWRGEVQYGLSHCRDARLTAEAALRVFLDGLGAGSMRLDTRTDELVLDAPALDVRQTVIEPVFEVEVPQAAGREVSIIWTEVRGFEAAPEVALKHLSVQMGPVAAAVATRERCLERAPERPFACDVAPSPLQLNFPRQPGILGFRPALSDEPLSLLDTDFAFSDDARVDGVVLPAADGFLDLGEGRKVVKDLRTNHRAFILPVDEARRAQVIMLDETLPDHEATRFDFWVVDDADLARRLADHQLRPIVYVGP